VRTSTPDVLTTLRYPRLFDFLLLRLCCHHEPMHLHSYQKFIGTVVTPNCSDKKLEEFISLPQSEFSDLLSIPFM